MATWEAIKPAPPVISIFFGSYDIFFFLQTVKYTCVSSLFPRGKNVFLAGGVLDGLMMWIEFDKKFTCLFFCFFETKNIKIKIKIIFPLHFTRAQECGKGVAWCSIFSEVTHVLRSLKARGVIDTLRDFVFSESVFFEAQKQKC